jgi:hypothetical protein
VSTTEELLGRKNSGSGIRRDDYATPLYPQNLAPTSPTNRGRSVGIVLSRTQATEFVVVCVYSHFASFVCCNSSVYPQIFISDWEQSTLGNKLRCTRHLAHAINLG